MEKDRVSPWSGALFPIRITQAIDSEGNPIYTKDQDGNEVPLMGWYPESSTNRLIKHNLTSILLYQIGQRFRNEVFGTRIYECIEEPNSQLLEFLIRDFLKSSIPLWEPRLTSLSLDIRREGSKLYIGISFQVNNSYIENLTLEYNSENYSIYVY